MEKSEEQKEQIIMIEENQDRGIIIVQNEEVQSIEGESTHLIQIDGSVIIQENQISPSINIDNEQFEEQHNFVIENHNEQILENIVEPFSTNKQEMIHSEDLQSKKSSTGSVNDLDGADQQISLTQEVIDMSHENAFQNQEESPTLLRQVDSNHQEASHHDQQQQIEETKIDENLEITNQNISNKLDNEDSNIITQNFDEDDESKAIKDLKDTNKQNLQSVLDLMSEDYIKPEYKSDIRKAEIDCQSQKSESFHKDDSNINTPLGLDQQNKNQKVQLTKQQRIQAFFEAQKIYPTLQAHSDLQISDDDLSEFYHFQKHFMIMTDAGKPVYSRYGDEEILSPFFATISAVIHKVQSYFVVVAEREQHNQLRWITSGEFSCAILKKGNLIYICLVNCRVQLNDEKVFKDDEFLAKQLKSLYQGQNSSKTSNKQNNTAFGMNMSSNPKNFLISRKRRLKESASYVRKQLEFLHLQFISLVTGNINVQLQKKPNLDIKTSILGLERTIDMMCDICYKSPSIFLQSFQPLRMPDSSRKVIEKCLEQNLPKTFACGMLMSALNPIAIFTDPEQVSEMKPHDIQVLMNYIFANPSLKNGGETWTPICIPGISEQFLLHIYIRYFTVNFGILIVCTDQNNFYECKEQAEEIYQSILEKEKDKEPQKPDQKETTESSSQINQPKDANIVQVQEKHSQLIDLIDKCTIQMYTRFNMKELQLVIIKNNTLQQFTTYNFPLLTQVNHWHLQCLKIFERMHQKFEYHLTQVTPKQRLSASQDFIIREVRDEFTFAYVNHVSSSIASAAAAQANSSKDGKDQIKRDYSLMICYDHRINNDFGQICKYLLDDIKSEGKNCFITRLV